MPCSAVTLSIATITAIVAAALMAIAFSTDNWLYIEVKRSKIQVSFYYYFLIYLFSNILKYALFKTAYLLQPFFHAEYSYYLKLTFFFNFLPTYWKQKKIINKHPSILKYEKNNQGIYLILLMHYLKYLKIKGPQKAMGLQIICKICPL